MADQLDSSIISVSVLDDFSDSLNELSAMLLRVDSQAEQVDPIDIDSKIAEVMADLSTVSAFVEKLDGKEATVHVDTDRDPLQERVAGVAARGRGRVGGLAMLGKGPGRDIDRDFDLNNLDIDVGARSSRAMSNVLSQTVGEAMDMPDLFEGRRHTPTKDLMKEFLDLELHMSGFMKTMASLIPLMAVFVGAFPAAIAGLGALAAAAIAASGALLAPVALGIGGMMFAQGELNVAELQDEIRNTLDAFLDSFAPVMDALQPMVEGLFDQFRFLIRDLSRRSNVLIQLTDEVAGAFGFLSETIGPALEDFIRFGEAAMPALQLFIGGLGSFDWFHIFSSLLRQTLPLLDILATHIVNLMPVLFEMSMGFFMVANAIFGFVATVLKLINAIPFALAGFTALIGIMFTAISASALYTVATEGVIATLITMAFDALPGAVMSLHSFIASMTTASIATWTLIGAASVLVGVLTFGLGPAIGGILGSFVGLGDGVARATDELGRFERQSARIGGPDLGGGPPGYGRSRPSYGRGGNTTVVAPDQETGNAVAANMRWERGWSPASPESDVNNRQHSE